MNKLKELRLSRNIKQADLAKILKVTQSTLSGWETERYDIGNDDLRKLADFFGVTTDYLLNRDVDITKLSNYVELPPENKKIPIIGSVKCGPNGLAYEYLEGYILVGENYTGDIIAFRCRGDSMKDIGISDGDIAIVRKQEDVESGDLAIVVIDGDEGTLKRVRKFDNGIALEAANQAYETRFFIGKELENIRIAGKVLEVRKKF